MRDESTRFEQVPLQEIWIGIAEGKITQAVLFDINAFEIEIESEDLQYPVWQKPLQEAFLELDKERLQQRISTAEFAVHSRLQNVAIRPELKAERQALIDALSSLRILKQDCGGLLANS